jgi:hypothetical protein
MTMRASGLNYRARTAATTTTSPALPITMAGTARPCSATRCSRTTDGRAADPFAQRSEALEQALRRGSYRARTGPERAPLAGCPRFRSGRPRRRPWFLRLRPRGHRADEGRAASHGLDLAHGLRHADRSTSATTTAAPSAPRRIASTRPVSVAAPVTIATLPASSISRTPAIAGTAFEPMSTRLDALCELGHGRGAGGRLGD